MRFHLLQEYMNLVDDYFRRLEMTTPVERRRVYVASDDLGVFKDIQKYYPQYMVLGDAAISKVAKQNRFSKESLWGLITDIHFLSKSDYLVGSFASNVNYYPITPPFCKHPSSLIAVTSTRVTSFSHY